MQERYLKLVGGFGAAFLIISVFTWQVGWAKIQRVFAEAHPGLLLGGGLIAFGGILLIGLAWWVVVRDVANVGALEGLNVFFVAQFANAITPFGQLGGEPFIAYILSRDAEIPFGESLGAVLAADILNTVPFFSMSFAGMAVYLFFFPSNPLVARIMQLFLLLAVLLIVAFLLLWYKNTTIIRLFGMMGYAINRITTIAGIDGKGKLGRITRKRLRDKGEELHSIFRELLQKKRQVGTALLLSHTANLFSIMGLYVILLALGFETPISGLLFVLPASLLAGYLPLPGGLGGIEVVLIILLTTLLGVPASTATAGALFFRVSTYWMIVLIGGVLSSFMSISIVAETG